MCYTDVESIANEMLVMQQPKLHNASELEILVQQIGVLPFFAYSIPEECTPSQYWFVYGVDGP